MAALFFLLLLAGCHTISATTNKPHKLVQTAKINGATADQVWPYIQDYCTLYLIFPSDVSFCTEGADGEKGQVRWSSGKIPGTKPNTTFVFYTRETLVKVNAKKRFLTYQMHENNFGQTFLIATMQALPDKNGSTFKWTVKANILPNQTHEQWVQGFQGIFTGIVALIQGLF